MPQMGIKSKKSSKDLWTRINSICQKQKAETKVNKIKTEKIR